jgi:hypothetical protein
MEKTLEKIDFIVIDLAEVGSFAEGIILLLEMKGIPHKYLHEL